MKVVDFNSINHGPYGDPHPQYDWLSGKNLDYVGGDGASYCELLSFIITAGQVDGGLSNFRFSFDLVEVASDNFNSIVNYSGIIKISSTATLAFMAQKNYILFDLGETGNGYTTTLQCYSKDITSGADSNKVYEVHLVLDYPGTYKSVKIIHPWFYFNTNNTNPLDPFVQYKSSNMLRKTYFILSKLKTAFVTSDKFPYFSGYTTENSVVNQPLVAEKPFSATKQLMAGNFGVKITGKGIFATKDGGNTWTDTSQKIFS